MATKPKNSNLHKANKAKNDEFYTQISDIEKELGPYKEHLKDKIVFCNCDDPEESHFWKYFSMSFEYLGLKKLISTHFERDKPSYKMEITRNVDQPRRIESLEKKAGWFPELLQCVNTVKTPLKQNGDFRSSECIELLKECDIVVTNPPFSLFREYLAILMEHDKKFLIIGNMNAITYKETFKFIKRDEVWLGRTSPKEFVEPSGNIKKFGNIKWFTNLDTPKRHEELILWKTYKGNESDYPHYDNYDAINIDKVKDIPVDYDGAMGVPITFMDKYNPEQFEIVSSNDFRLRDTVPFKEHGLIKDKDGSIKGKPKYVRIVIRRRNN